MNWELEGAVLMHLFPGTVPGRLTLRRFFDLGHQAAEISRLKRGGKPRTEKARAFGEPLPR